MFPKVKRLLLVDTYIDYDLLVCRKGRRCLRLRLHGLRGERSNVPREARLFTKRG